MAVHQRLSSPPLRRASQVGRLSLDRLADRVRQEAISTEAGGRDALLMIAEELTELARDERRILEHVAAAQDLTPWMLRVRFGLKSPKGARLLHRLVRTAGRFQHRDILRRSVETTRNGLTTLICEIRRAIEPLGLRGELSREEDGYVLSRRAADVIRAHCEPDLMDVDPLLAPDGSIASIPDLPWRHAVDLTDRERTVTSQPPAAPGVLGPAIQLLAVLHQGARLGRATPALQSGEPDSADLLFSLMCQRGGMPLHLLLMLASNAGRFVPAEVLTAEVGCSDASLKVFISKLRQQFRSHGLANPVESARTAGYRLAPAAFDALAVLGERLRNTGVAAILPSWAESGGVDRL